MNYFIFTIDKKYYAVILSVVQKVIRAVELINVPKAPDMLLGLINMEGNIIPVVNIRKAFHLPDCKIEINDRIIISSISSQQIAFIVDTVEGVVDESFKLSSSDQVDQVDMFREMKDYIEGVGKIDNHPVIIYNIDKLFSIGNFQYVSP